ncbi:MAG: nucleoside kinase [Clostridia bacterium]|nr:nucleoside kinase [Clostridia bacterium]
MKIQYKEKIIEIEKKEKISELLKEEIKNNPYPVVGAIYNNQYVNLDFEIKKDGKIELIDTSEKEGMRIYKRTLIYIFAKALKKLYPDNKATVNYQLANATYCDIGNIEVTEELVQKIQEEMRAIVRSNLPIKEIKMTREEAEKFYQETNTRRGKLQYDLKSNKKIYMYFCEDYFNYCYGTIANHTGATKIFEIIKYDKGLLIRYPSIEKPNQMPKLMQNKKIKWALNEYNDIHKILNINTVYKLNDAVEEKRIKDVIMLDEALHEKKIANIADKVARNRNIKMILIAGPSSSGKTTFAQRLGIQLRINKLKPVTISVDNYFVERKDTPRDENGDYNFECIEAIDLKLFNDHLTKLLNGEEIEMPQFDFLEGTKKYNGNKLKLKEDEVLVIEGIHCLNDKLTSSIPQEGKFKIYISALTVLNMDRYTKVSSSDTRLIRRIVRDYQFRGYTAKHTLETWHSVTRGEVENIFPFQEGANAIFNTSLIYELGVLKGIAKPILEEIPKEEPEYAEAQRLLNMLKYIRTIPAKAVPTNSLLKEFVGGGDFKY